MTIEIHELDITDGLNKMLYDELKAENEKLKKQLDIAVKTLESIKHAIDYFEDDPMNKIKFMAYGNLWSVRDVAKEALKRIKKLDNELELDDELELKK